MTSHPPHPPPSPSRPILASGFLLSYVTTSLPTQANHHARARTHTQREREIQDIGMGWYQWQLFVVVGFGWASDNLWPIVTSLIFAPVANEFRPALLTLAQNVGLLAGAVFWGFGRDVFGRRRAFNLTPCPAGLRRGYVGAGGGVGAGLRRPRRPRRPLVLRRRRQPARRLCHLPRVPPSPAPAST